MSLRWRLGLIAAAYVLVTLLGGLATVLAAQQWSEALDDRRAWLVASEQAARSRASYVDQETGQRGYVITARDDFLEPYERGQAETAPLVVALEQIEGNNDAHPLPISGVEQAVDNWRSEAEREITAVRAGNSQLADALVTAGTAKARFDIFRDRLDQLDGAIDRGSTQ